MRCMWSQTGRVARAALAGVVALLLGAQAWALEPDELVLVTNRAVPQGVELARFYASQRGVPVERIVELDLPAGEDMGMEQYDAAVVRPIRQFLDKNGLRDKAQCLVTFYGVPLRLMPRRNTTQQAQELEQIQGQLKQTLEKLDETIIAMERTVVAQDPGYRPSTGGDLGALADRAERVMTRASELAAAGGAEAKETLQTAMAAAMLQMGGPAAMLQQELAQRAAEGAAPAEKEADRQKHDLLEQRVAAAKDELPTLLSRRDDAASRERLRRNSGECFGLFDLARTLEVQADYLRPTAIKAMDSELPLLWYDQYGRAGGMANPLSHRHRAAEHPARTLMVMRLDGPQPGLVREMIVAAKVVETKGLAGRFVIDSRGLDSRTAKPADMAYVPFDEKLRRLADLVRAKTKMSLVHDDAPEVIGPGAVGNVALYCGWYKVRHYVPCCTFVPGAIGFHVASFEMVSLHNPKENGWCRGLLNDGIAATLGPVDEPLLDAFPDPEEFFGVLMTGKTTLAEAYWLTNPVVSWKMTAVGDPLYRPFAARPALRVEDLPPNVRRILEPTGGE